MASLNRQAAKESQITTRLFVGWLLELAGNEPCSAINYSDARCRYHCRSRSRFHSRNHCPAAVAEVAVRVANSRAIQSPGGNLWVRTARDRGRPTRCSGRRRCATDTALAAHAGNYTSYSSGYNWQRAVCFPSGCKSASAGNYLPTGWQGPPVPDNSAAPLPGCRSTGSSCSPDKSSWADWWWPVYCALLSFDRGQA